MGSRLHSRVPGLLPAMAALCFLVSCTVEELPPSSSPPPSSSSVPVAGTDADGDGVRDDVQAWLQAAFPDSTVRAAARQLAVALQGMLVNASGASGARIAAAAMNAAIDCLYALDPATFGSRVDAIEEAVVNTGNRARAYARAGDHLSGVVYVVSAVADNLASCAEEP